MTLKNRGWSRVDLKVRHNNMEESVRYLIRNEHDLHPLMSVTLIFILKPNIYS